MRNTEFTGSYCLLVTRASVTRLITRQAVDWWTPISSAHILKRTCRIEGRARHTCSTGGSQPCRFKTLIDSWSSLGSSRVYSLIHLNLL